MLKILSRLSLNAQLFLFNGILIFFILLISVFAQLTISSNNHTLEKVVSNESAFWVNQSEVIKSDLQAYLWAAYGLYAENTPVTGGPINDINDSIKNFNQAIQKYVAVTTFNTEAETRYKKITASWSTISADSQKVIDALKDGKEKRDDIKKQISTIGDSCLDLSDDLSSVLSQIRKDTIALHLDAKAKEKRDFIGLIVILVIAVLIAVSALLFARRLSRSIQEHSNGLFSQSKDISSVSATIKHNADTLSQSIEGQSSSIHETTAAINEITSMVQRTTENTNELSQVARSASEKAVDGQKIMQQLVAAMETIQTSNAQLQNIGAIIGQIHSKTAVINEIVSKTELLSLNASIESARAGEHGKGFAVVAEEVGNLAKISGKSAQEIQALITTSQEQVNQILGITKSRVDEAKSVTSAAQQSFHVISDNISTLTSVIMQITDATKEQEIGVRQITSAMSHIDKSTHSIQEAANSTSEASTKLVSQSDKLDISSKVIEELVNGKPS